MVFIMNMRSCMFLVPPKIKTPLNDIRIKAGQIFHVDIDFIGEPPPEVIWSVASKPLKTDERTTVTSIGYHTIVHTVNTKRSDSGLYHLMLRNSSGLDEGSFQVIILGKNLWCKYLYQALYAVWPHFLVTQFYLFPSLLLCNWLLHVPFICQKVFLALRKITGSTVG